MNHEPTAAIPLSRQMKQKLDWGEVGRVLKQHLRYYTRRLMLKPPAIDTPAIDTPGVFSLTDPKKFKPPQSHNFNADNYCVSWLM